MTGADGWVEYVEGMPLHCSVCRDRIGDEPCQAQIAATEAVTRIEWICHVRCMKPRYPDLMFIVPGYAQ